ncbi:MAG TPA: N-acetyltransferase [Gammaproteobacteria bacterium]|nr:N-acetyltransferase [Gammaproteobacteria bacterium]
MTDLCVTGLRRAGPADLDIIAALESACFGTADGAFTRHQLRALLNNPNAFWLLSLDGRAVGCWLKVSNGRARWARLYSLAVHPDLRGQGWGKRLMEAGFAWMQEEQITVCRAEVKVKNLTARRLYADYGFRETGHLPGYYAPGVDGIRLMYNTV